VRVGNKWLGQLAIFEVFAFLNRLYSVALSLSHGPETLGIRPEAVTMMVQQMGPIERVYDLLLNRTGIVVPEVEELLAQSP